VRAAQKEVSIDLGKTPGRVICSLLEIISFRQPCELLLHGGFLTQEHQSFHKGAELDRLSDDENA
jgi:hypothetical protein